MTRVADVVRSMHRWCPPETAQSYDNVGLQVGDGSRSVERALVALDLTPAVVEEAIDLEAELVITHHPAIFKPVRSVQSDDLVGGMLLRLIEQRVALLAAHTNLDAARNGVSTALARQLDLENLRFLEPQQSRLVKLSTFVPSAHADHVRSAIAEAGGGVIGDYDSCSFSVSGIGTFRPLAGSTPTIGNLDTLERVEEIRLEVEVNRSALNTVIEAMREAHPYEEVAFDVVSLDKPTTATGLGMVGELSSALPMRAFLDHVAARLDSRGIRYTANPDRAVRVVGVCGGSGSDLIRAAFAAGADAYVTGDVTYHHFFATTEPNGEIGMAIIDAGHYETERPAERLIAETLSKLHPDVDFRVTARGTNPVRYH